MDYFNAFWVGGLICALVQILLDKTKLLPGRVMVILVCSGVILSAVGLYQPLTDYAGAGASVPLTGFGQILWKGMKKAIDHVKKVSKRAVSFFFSGNSSCAFNVYRLFKGNAGASCQFSGSHTITSISLRI